MTSQMTPSRPQYKVVGTRPKRRDAVDKVTGRALFGADMHLPGLLHGKVLRSPHAHARILSIDTSKAEAGDLVYSVSLRHCRHCDRGHNTYLF